MRDDQESGGGHGRAAGTAKRTGTRLGILGLGPIGRGVLRIVAAGEISGMTAVAVATRSRPSELPPQVAWCGDIDALIAARPDLVVEGAGTEVLIVHGARILAAGIDLMPLSITAFAVAAFEEAAIAAARASGARILLPSGAVGGLDAIAAAREGGLDSVIMTQRKHPTALLSAQDAGAVRKATVLSEGSAREAALKFPKNSNIAAALAMAGIGFDRTVVRVVADPAVTANTVEIEASGWFGRMRVVLENVPSENKRTSRLAGLAAIASLRRRDALVVCPA